MSRNGAVDVGNGAFKAAVCDAAGQPETIRSENGGKSWPAYLFVPLDGPSVLGDDAKEQSLVTPERVLSDIKQHISDPHPRYLEKTMSAREAASVAIKIVVDRMEKQTGQKLEGVVVTCPANFTDDQRNALIEAFEAARVKVVQCITEPGAAAYAYCCKKPVSSVACIDVGHGTVDVTVMQVKDGVAVPIATEGVAQLGGRDFTGVLMDISFKKLSEALGKAMKRKNLDPRQLAELETKVERAKHSLGNLASSTISVNLGGQTQTIEITRDEYEDATKQFVEQILKCADEAMASAEKEWSDIEMLVLAGGHSLSPRFQERVADHTGLVPKVEIDPEVVVAHGAAIHARHLAGPEDEGKVIPNRPILREATGHDVGVAVEDESKDERPVVCDVIVPKNTPVPVEWPVKVYRLPTESSTEAVIEIVQGPHNAPVKECIRIGLIELKGLPREPLRTKRIEVYFKIDKNGMCEVTARDNVSEISQTVSVKLACQDDNGGKR